MLQQRLVRVKGGIICHTASNGHLRITETLSELPGYRLRQSWKPSVRSRLGLSEKLEERLAELLLKPLSVHLRFAQLIVPSSRNELGEKPK